MSDTPLTDAEERRLHGGGYSQDVVPADFARELERRVAELEALIKSASLRNRLKWKKRAEEAEQDAARYQCLRDNWFILGDAFPWDGMDEERAYELDAAIDKAIMEGK